MTIKKYAESKISAKEIHSPKKALSDPQVSERFMKLAKKLKKVAPRANDFLYFSCIMLHAAEAALIDQEKGETIVKDGNPVTANWEVNDQGSWKWVCSDDNLRPYKNNNGDIFPEVELKKAYKNWIGRPLCKDHQSSSVDGVRGIIIDAYWDNKRKRVIGLCALDKINYPDLARKVETGYTTSVSMGTAVGKSICYNCGTIATTEAEYCPCVKGRSTYGEINIDLSPLELSLVVTGADPRAKLRNIVASLNKYTNKQSEKISELKAAGCVTPVELERVEAKIEEIKNQLFSLVKEAKIDSPEEDQRFRNFVEALKGVTDPEVRKSIEEQIATMLGPDTPEGVAGLAQEVSDSAPYGIAGSYGMGASQPFPQTDPEQGGSGKWGPEGMRLASDNEVSKIYGKLEDMEQKITKLTQVFMEENTMSEKELKSRAISRRAYWLGGGGVNEPTPGKPKYEKDPMGDNVRNKEDKQMSGQGMESGSDGLHPGYGTWGKSEVELKKMLSRAQMEQRKINRHALLSQANEVVPVTDQNDKVVGYKQVQPAEDGEEMNTNPMYAQDKPACPSCGKTASSIDNMLVHLKTAHPQKLAYWLGGGGINEPTPGKEKYPKDPMGDNVRNTQDKQMVGEGLEMGSDGLFPGDLEAKKKVLRASKLSAKMIKVKNKNGSVNRFASKWVIYAGDKPILQANGSQAFGDKLNDQWSFFASKDYGLAVMAHIRKNGFNKTAYSLTGDKRFKFAAGPEGAADPMADMGADPMADMGAEGLPASPEAVPVAEEVESVKGAVEDALKTVENTLGDLREALEGEGTLEGGKEELPPVEIGEEETAEEEKVPAETPAETPAEEAAPAPETVKASAQITTKIADLYQRLDDNGDELALLSKTFGKQLATGTLTKSTGELVRLAQESLEENNSLVSKAFVVLKIAKPKKGVNPFAKDDDDKDNKKDDKEEKSKKSKKSSKESDKKEDKKDDKESKESKESKKTNKSSKESKAEAMLTSLLKTRADYRAELAKAAEKALDKEEELEADDIMGDDIMGDDLMDTEMYDLDGIMNAEDVIPEIDEEELEAEFDTAISAEAASNDINVRKAWREKVAAEYMLKLDSQTTVDSDVYPKAHPGGGTTVGNLDTKPSENLHHFETIEEQHNAILKEVQSLPKVREAISHLSQLLKSGALKDGDLSDPNKLKAFAVDSETVSYWKKYFGMGDRDAKQYGTEMTKEYMKKKASENKENFKLKMRRAYDIALEMADKNMIAESEIHKQADNIASFGDKEFEIFKNAIERTSGAKIVTASSTELPAGIGVRESGVSVDGKNGSLGTQLKALW